jgi:chorismate mutase
MPVQAIRGATTVDHDNEEQIVERVAEMMATLYRRNALLNDELISVLVTATDDIHAFHPATAVRRFGLVDVPIMGAREVEIVGGLERCIRVMVHVESNRSRAALRHVFLHGARVLRPDLADDDDDE